MTIVKFSGMTVCVVFENVGGCAFDDDGGRTFEDDSYYGFLLRSRITATMDSPWIPAKAGITVSLNSGKTNTEIS